MKKINIHPLLAVPTTELYFGERLLEGKLLAELCKESKNRIVIVADRALQDLYTTKLAQRLNAHLLTIPSNEKIKTNETAETIEHELFRLKYGKDTTLIAVGGGVTTDLAGFVASIYMRGIDLILVPTTLLAMVDASIGGKTAIDTPFGKNLIGTTYLPRAIITDIETLKTLSDKEWFNGLAEILKIGLISDASIWKIAEKEIKNSELILKAIQAKINIIEKDPAEKGLRRILNFGHTIAHGMEAISHYEISHGEAVAIGCVIESYLSLKLGYLPENEFGQLQSIYRSFSLKLPHKYDRKKLIEAMSLDKKNIDNQIRFVLIDRIGHALSFDKDYCRPVSEEELISTLDWMEKTYG
jgi:3-dehydroquinate synthase